MQVQVLRPPTDSFTEDPKSEYVDVHGLLSLAEALIRPDRELGIGPTHLLFSGSHGVGKSLAAACLRQRLACPMGVVECSEGLQDYALRGAYVILPAGSTAFNLGPFPLAVEIANETGMCLLCAEEISRLPPNTQTEFNKLCESWSGQIYVPQLGKVFSLSDGAYVAIIGTMNPSKYGGAFELNHDLSSRFTELEFPHPDIDSEASILSTTCPFADRATVAKLVTVAGDLRNARLRYEVSTRDLVAVLRNSHKLGGIKKPLELLVNKYSGSDRDTVEDRIGAVFTTTPLKGGWL